MLKAGSQALPATARPSWQALLAAWLAFGLGSSAAWATTGRVGLLRLALALGVVSIVHVGVTRWAGLCWGWGLVPFFVLVSWAAAAPRWGWSLPWAAALCGLALWARAAWACGAWRPQRAIAAAPLVACGVLGAAVALRVVPVWSLTALLALPLAVRWYRGRHRFPEPGFRDRGTALAMEFYVAFVGLSALGFLIKGIVR